MINILHSTCPHPYGISLALWLFMSFTKPIVKFLVVQDIVFESYIDNCIQANEDPGILLHLIITQRLLHQFGWLVNAKKSEPIPTQRLQFMGTLFDTRLRKMFMPYDRWVRN